MKRTLTGIAAASMVLSTFAPMAMAQANNTNWQYRDFMVNNQDVATSVPGFVYQGTYYTSIYNVQKVLTALGLTNSWKVNALTINFTGTVGTLPQVNGNASVYINNNGTVTKVMNFNHISATAPGDKNPTSFIPVYDIEVLLRALGYPNQYDGVNAYWNVVNQSLSITGNNAVGTGQFDNLVLDNSVGGTATAVTSGVTWTVTSSNSSTAVVSPAGQFTASAPGTYTVEATSKGQSATANVTVYGAAAGVTLSPAKSSIVADGTDSDQITVSVVDANGNVVGNFNGYVDLGTYGSDPALSTNWVKITNGTGTATLTDANGAGDKVTIYSSEVENQDYDYLPNIPSSSTVVTAVAPAATTFTLTPASKQVANNTGTQADVVTVGVLDQAGNPADGGPYYTTFTLSGPATFSNGTQTLTEYVNAGSTVNVYPTKGVAGTITLTASASGFNTASTTITSVTTTAPASLSVTSQAGTGTNPELDGEMPYTVYTVQLVDKNGVPVSPGTADNITITDNSGQTGATLEFFNYSGGTVGSQLTPNSGAETAVLGATSGSYQFAVSNEAAGSGAVTLTIKDSVTGTSQTIKYNPQAGAADDFRLTAPAVSSGLLVKAGDQTHYTFQAEDYYGNPVDQSGLDVAAWTSGNFNTGGPLLDGKTYTHDTEEHLYTNAQGQVNVTVAVPSAATSGYYQVYLSGYTPYGGDSYASGSAYIVPNAWYPTNIVVTDTTNSESSGTYLPKGVAFPSTNMAPGETLQQYVGTTGTLYALPVNALGEFKSSFWSDATWNMYDQVLEVQSSNSKVLSVASGSTYFEKVYEGLPTIKAEQAGTATLTITDLDAVDGKVQWTKSFTIHVGAPAQIQGENTDGSTGQEALKANTVAGPYTLQVEDAGGNTVGLNNGPITLSAAQVESILGVQGSSVSVRTSAAGSEASYVTIPNGQSTVQVWLDNSSGTATTTDPVAAWSLSVLPPVAESATYSSSANTVTVTFDDALVGTPVNGSFTVDGATVTAAKVSGSTVVLTVSGTPDGNVYWSDTGLTTGYGVALPDNTSGLAVN